MKKSNKHCGNCGSPFVAKFITHKWCSLKCRKIAYNKRHPDNPHTRHNWYRYGLSENQYKELLAKQNGTCAICKKPEITTKRRNGNNILQSLSVDHDHNTKKIRGLLCNKCNTALGLLEENIDTIHNLLKYLEVNQY